jgi:hypothetical protein
MVPLPETIILQINSKDLFEAWIASAQFSLFMYRDIRLWHIEMVSMVSEMQKSRAFHEI